MLQIPSRAAVWLEEAQGSRPSQHLEKAKSQASPRVRWRLRANINTYD